MRRTGVHPLPLVALSLVLSATTLSIFPGSFPAFAGDRSTPETSSAQKDTTDGSSFIKRVVNKLRPGKATPTAADIARVRESITGYPGNSIILLESDGSPRDPDTRRRLDGDLFDQHVASILKGVSDRFPAPADTIRILIYVHGGLNRFDGALEKARDLAGELHGTTAEERRYFPLSIVWSSDFATATKDQVLRDRAEVVPGPFEKAVTAPIMVLSTLGRGIGDSPVTVLRQSRQDLQAVAPGMFAVTGYTRAIYDSLANRQGEYPDVDPLAIQVSWPKDDGLGFWRRTGRAFLYARTLPFTFGLSWVVAAPGAEAWHSMKARSQNIVRTAGEFQAPENIGSHTELPALTPEPLGSGGLVRYIRALTSGLDSLEAQRTDSLRKPNAIAGPAGSEKENVSAPPVRFTLVGHSMGTIILNRILELWPDLYYEEIIYMAAACSAREFERAAVAVLEESEARPAFYNLCLHPDNELREVNFGDYPQRGTLLTWIDNFYTVPETYLDNRWGRWEVALAASRIFPEDVRGRVRLKAFGAGYSEEPRHVSRFREYRPGTVGPRKHGDFSGYRFWDPAFYRPDFSDPGSDSAHTVPPKRSARRRPKARKLFGAGFDLTSLFDDPARLWTATVGMSVEGGGEIAAGFRRLTGGIVRRDRRDGTGREKLSLFELGVRIDYAQGRLANETFAGWGRGEWRGGAGDAGDRRRDYLVLEPTTAVRIFGPLWAGVGYRWTLGADSPFFSNVGLSGWVAQARVVFPR